MLLIQSRSFAYLLVFLSVFVLAAGQIALKIASGRLVTLSALFSDMRGAAMLALAALLLTGASIIWLFALRTLPLSQAYSISSLSFVLIPLLAHFFLGEELSRNLLFGTGLVIAGVWLCTFGQ